MTLLERKGRENMEKTISKILTASVAALLVLSILAAFPASVKASPGPVITVEPASVSYTTEEVTVGDWFIVEVKVSNPDAWNLMMFQVTIRYKEAYLTPSMKGTYIWSYPSGLLGVAPPESWDTSYVFYGSSGTIGNPSIMDGDPDYDSIMLGETLLAEKALNAGETYLLARFNFTIKAVPGKGETFTSALNINSDGTFMYDVGGEVIVGPSSDIHDGEYTLAWAMPPAPDVYVVRADGQPWPLVFPEYQDAVGQTFDVQIILDISAAWGLTNATLALNYNETLIEILGGDADVDVDSFWPEYLRTFETGKLTIFVNATAPPGADTLVATITFTVLYQGTFPDEDSTALTLSDVELWDHQYAIAPGTLGEGEVIVKGRTQLPDPDVNNDGEVDMIDIYLVALHFGCSEGETGYDSNYDLDGNKVIDLLDIYKVASKFGTTV